MAKRKIPDGLCQTCEDASSCCLPSSSTVLLQYCEEFRTCKPEAVSRADEVGTPARRAPSEYSDLCNDCENRQGCVLCGAEGGVWHCEEYK